MSSSPSRRMKIGDFLLRRLDEASVRHGVPGDYNLELLQQLQDTSTLKWIGTCRTSAMHHYVKPNFWTSIYRLEPTRRPKPGACNRTSALNQQSGYQAEYEFPSGERQ